MWTNNVLRLPHTHLLANPHHTYKSLTHFKLFRGNLPARVETKRPSTSQSATQNGAHTTPSHNWRPPTYDDFNQREPRDREELQTPDSRKRT